MYLYEINVSLNGRHFFATAERSITSRKHLEKVFLSLSRRFLPEDGYSITVSEAVNHGRNITDSIPGEE